MSQEAGSHSLTLEIEHKGSTAIVHCHGRLYAGACSALYAKVHPLIPDHKRIILDLTDLTSVDSMGLGALVRLYVSAKSSGSCIELINLGKQVSELLGITNLLSLFGDMCDKGIAIKF